ncbi:Protein of unknown function (DUF3110) [Xenococcus sp. PCC 7305]|uniref:DUF3110 domain-containing protein n=1 Tax=Xenococcus sp. PCC 7305 TaxID=102125 RepID=UPI0002AC8BC9|nr:DUF3110 domain-containing protein [Xenococcus sp. PCC 7305]ELS05212.1 Protein of unknown function (DUF3110) [Xenococcus sp. PCC 7305]
MRVYILLFNARTNNEGIHTIQIGDRQKVLMFQEEDDATRFAIMLEAQDFPEPTVEEIDSEEVKAFCEKADYDSELIEPGQLALPPEKNVEQTDWDQESEGSSVADAKSDSKTMAQNELERIRQQLEGLL